MGKLEEIKEKLLAGSTTKQLIKQGYPKSSIFHVARKIKDIQPGMSASSIPDDLQELRHQRDIIKLQKEIADLEAAKEKLPERVANLEARLEDLHSALPILVGHCYTFLFTMILASRGRDWDEAAEEARKVADVFMST